MSASSHLSSPKPPEEPSSLATFDSAPEEALRSSGAYDDHNALKPVRRRGDDLVGLVLAGGRGVRMGCSFPKALQLLQGRPLLAHVLEALDKAGVSKRAVVIGNHHEGAFRSFLSSYRGVGVCVQDRPGGTAHAASCGGYLWGQPDLPHYVAGSWCQESGDLGDQLITRLLICLGDVPRINPEVLCDLLSHHHKLGAHLSLATMSVPDPSGYGRVILDDSLRVKNIIEEKHCTEAQRAISLCSSGVMVAEVGPLFKWLGEVRPQSNGEYYLTDVVAYAYSHGYEVRSYCVPKWQDFLGLNTPLQLSQMQDRLSAPVAICETQPQDLLRS